MSANLEETMKACPFCNGVNVHLHQDGDDGNAYVVMCHSCNSSSSEKHTPELAIDAWNARATGPAETNAAERPAPVTDVPIQSFAA